MNGNNKLLPYARELRKEMTPYERKLWYTFLRKYPVKINKQKIIDRYIVDFYCHSAKLVIEVDGIWHYEKDISEYDRIREEYLESCGLKVIRFSNEEISRDFRNVCSIIHGQIQLRSK